MSIFTFFNSTQNRQGKLFHDILGKKTTPFVGNKSWKSRKFGIFQKGLVQGFGQKVSMSSCFYLKQNKPGKCVSRYSKKKKRLSGK